MIKVVDEHALIEARTKFAIAVFLRHAQWLEEAKAKYAKATGQDKDARDLCTDSDRGNDGR